MPYSLKYYGPPGTGKTTKETTITHNELEAGLHPLAIGLYSFTKAAAYEARRRVMERFTQYNQDDFEHFRTIHSECYRLLQLQKGDLVTPRKLKEFGEKYGYEFTSRPEPDEEHYEISDQQMVRETLADHMHFFDEWRRHEMIFDLDKAYNEFTNLEETPQGWSRMVVFAFCQRYEAWKQEEGLLDFVDMLVMVYQDKLKPHLKVILLDEAQDQGRLLWAVFDMWAANTEREYIAGDDDQCMYDWAAAHPELFLYRHCDKEETLDQSYRLTEWPLDFALKIIRQNKVRKDKLFLPRGDYGEVKKMDFSSKLVRDLEARGTVFILARNTYMLKGVMRALLVETIPFGNLRGAASHTDTEATAIKAGIKLHETGTVDFGGLQALLGYIPVQGRSFLKQGVKSWVKDKVKESADAECDLMMLANEWFKPQLASMFYTNHLGFLDAMTRLDREKRDFLKSLTLKRGVKALEGKPNITLGNYHSVKGMERDNVILLSDMSFRSHRSFRGRGFEAENRVFYVGATRSRNGVYIVNPETYMHYDWPPVAMAESEYEVRF